VKELLLVWAIDDTGGESPASTYSYGGETYTLAAGEPDLTYDRLLGTYTAVYVYTTAWSFTP
jgi:hypothetical protein